MHKVLAIVPARGGSKGVPGKNIRIVGGLPLIAYTLRTAMQAGSIDRVVVTTDAEPIAAIARNEGADVIMRPPEIAADESPVIDAVRHALDTLAQSDGFEPDVIVLLQPTSPFRSPDDIDEGVRLFRSNGGSPVCSVCRCEDNHPARMYRIEDGRLSSLVPDEAQMRRQDLPPVYVRNGALYVFGPREVGSGHIIGGDMVPYVMPAAASVNIDTETDLLLMAAMLERTRENSAARA